jgi:SAM-dependent methyltransferase
VTDLVAIEPEPTLRAEAEVAARRTPVPIRVLPGVADALPLPDGSADAAIASLVLCSVPDQPHALAEMRRVLRPGGELRFYEHVVPRRQPKRDAAGRRPERHLAGRGGRLPPRARDTTGEIMRAGFDIEEIERFRFGAQPFLPSIPHVLGLARRVGSQSS